MTSLNLSNNEFGSPKVRSEQLPSNIGAASQRLPPLPSLRWLDLSNNELRHLSPSVLYNCRALRHLGLANNKLDHLPDDLADRLPHLTSVELGNNDLKKASCSGGEECARRPSRPPSCCLAAPGCPTEEGCHAGPATGPSGACATEHAAAPGRLQELDISGS